MALTQGHLLLIPGHSHYNQVSEFSISSHNNICVVAFFFFIKVILMIEY